MGIDLISNHGKAIETVLISMVWSFIPWLKVLHSKDPQDSRVKQTTNYEEDQPDTNGAKNKPQTAQVGTTLIQLNCTFTLNGTLEIL